MNFGCVYCEFWMVCVLYVLDGVGIVSFGWCVYCEFWMVCLL